MFVLAPNKDLAVSAWCYHQDYPEGYPMAFASGRFCSHLYHYWRRALPAIFLDSNLIGEWVFGLSSPTRHFEIPIYRARAIALPT